MFKRIKIALARRAMNRAVAAYMAYQTDTAVREWHWSVANVLQRNADDAALAYAKALAA